MSITLSFNRDNSGTFERALSQHEETRVLAAEIARVGRFGSQMTLEIDGYVFKPGLLERIYEIARATDVRSIMGQVAAIRTMRDSPDTTKLGRNSTKNLETGILAYLKHNFIDGWLYEKTHSGPVMMHIIAVIKNACINLQSALLLLPIQEGAGHAEGDANQGSA